MSDTLDNQGQAWNWWSWSSHPANRWWTTLIVLVIVAAIAGIAMQSSQRQFCRLFDRYDVTSAEKHRILIALGNANLAEYEVRGDQILVPTNEKAKYLAAIDDEQALPLIFQQRHEPKPNMFLPRSQQAMIEQSRKKRQVREMILSLPFVREAWFEIDWVEPSLTIRNPQQSAVVLIRTAKEDVLNRQQAQAIQRLVAGAIAGLQSHEVVVTDANIGISYHNLDEHRQSVLIEQVTWRMGRRQHYQEQLQHLTHEYPGLELQIEVERGNAPIPPKEDVIASEIPSKFAGNVLSTSKRQLPPTMSLNGGGSVDDVEPVSDIRRDLYVSQASFTQPTNLTSDVAPEAVRIQVRLPTTTINGHAFGVEVKSEEERFRFLKTEITNKIKAVVPESVLSASLPIVFVRDSCGIEPARKANAVVESFKEYWPFAALALLGYAAVVFSRSGAVAPAVPARLTNEERPESTLDETELQSQLAKLIDSHPEAAAEVLKNWIRESS